jgi:rfaE bifunctional protein kinase chain/domain/rfaE bifunctional protein nucleotidyltransferase chain/domain
MSPQRKICSLEQLLDLRARAARDGRTVVHCHGCFDIVHPGHIHHLQHARSLGDLLVVTVSSDGNVNKGIDRPLIPDDLRAASLAALECVDLVYVNEQATAVELLERLKPDVYVKGREYETNHDPRFLAERDAVARHGGRVVFSSGDVVYSSTALIAQMQRTQQYKGERLDRFCRCYDVSTANLQALLQRFRGQRVLVVGDYILDRYHFCDASGIAGEGPMMALRALETKDFDGGAAVVAQHLLGLGAAPTLVTATADDEVSRQAELRLRAAGVTLHAHRNRRQVVAKHRYLVDESKIFKVDEGSTAPLDSRDEQQLAETILAAADGAAAVIFADFGYGLITSGLLDRIMRPLRESVPVITADVSGRQSNLLRFRGVDLLCPTEREVRETLHDFSSGLGAVVANLLNATDARQAIITLGKQGLVTFDWPKGSAEASGHRLRSEYVPALATRTVDPLGCGDALLATASLTLAAGGSLHAAAFLGSLAAAVEVERLGNVPVTTDRILGMLVENELAPAVTRLAS